MSLYIDLSQFFLDPITTGIQRIAGELCKYAPDGAFTPLRFGTDDYVAFDPLLTKVIGKHFDKGSEAGKAEIERLSFFGYGRKVTIAPGDRVLVPEVFDNAHRLTYFRRRSDEELKQFWFIAFDLLPLTHPQYFWAGIRIYDYFRLLRRAHHCAFISEDTRRDYYVRAKRLEPDGGGRVLPLGSDALGPRVTSPPLNRPLSFSVIGTIEPRKNHALILEAFEPLLKSIPGLTLSFVGRMGWVSSQFSQKIQSLAADPKSGFRFFSTPGDQELRKCIETSRATIYCSSGEGYGLPPVESLWLGTPVIASDTIPSLRPFGSTGIQIVDPLNAINIRRAVLAFNDDGYANQKTRDTTQLDLPTWRSFAEETLRWCAEAGLA